MNRIDELFQRKKQNVLNIYCTAGYPELDSTIKVMTALQENGADMIELGMPYSDPLADGPVIQLSNMRALQNGMSIPVLFEQLRTMREHIKLPVILMGYMNPVLQFGFEKFCREANKVGIDGIILPDLPMFEFQQEYSSVIQKNNLHFIFLITPETSAERIKQLDGLSSGFIYAVSSSSTTGNNKSMQNQEAYFKKIASLQLKNPVLVGFGVKDRNSFREASRYSNGAIIGTAFIRALENAEDVSTATKNFLQQIV